MRVLIASDNQITATKLRRAVIQYGHDSDIMSIEHARESIRNRQPGADLLFLVLSDDMGRSIEDIKWLNTQAKARIVAVGAASESRWILESLHAGASDYMDVNDNIQQQVNSCLQRFKSQISPSSQRARFMAVTGVGGGAGTSFVAANLAILQARTHQECGLLDLDIQKGDQATFFDVKPRYTIADLCRNLKNLDRNMLEQSLTPHSSGVKLLAAPQHLSEQQFPTPEGLLTLATFARESFPALVVDVHDAGNADRKGLLQSADIIVVVLRMDLPSLRNLRRLLEYWNEIGIDSNNVRVVANRYDKRNPLPTSKVQSALRTNIEHYIPEDAVTVGRSINLGCPAVIESPKSAVASSLVEMAEKFAITSSSPPDAIQEQRQPKDTLLERISKLTRIQLPQFAGIEQ